MLRLSAEVKEDMVQRLRDGWTVRKLAREHNLPYASVRLIAIKNKIPLTRGRRPGDNSNMTHSRFAGFDSLVDRDNAIIEELKRNSNMADVARQFGVSREWVRKIAEKFHLNLNNRKGFLHQQNLELLAPMMDIAKNDLCVRCQKSPIVKDHNQSHLCDACFQRRRVAGWTISRLKMYLKTGEKRNLNQAAWFVRAYGITPQDLRSY